MPTYICGTGADACETRCRLATMRAGKLCPTAPELREIARELETTVGALVRDGFGRVGVEGGFGLIDNLCRV
ncbi:hypothetical protein J2X03_003826 [Microbacterium trichothecenolyticum]|nr:hypothetical protein [Microbacterium trichothecenolyticum]